MGVANQCMALHSAGTGEPAPVLVFFKISLSKNASDTSTIISMMEQGMRLFRYIFWKLRRFPIGNMFKNFSHKASLVAKNEL